MPLLESLQTKPNSCYSFPLEQPLNVPVLLELYNTEWFQFDSVVLKV